MPELWMVRAEGGRLATDFEKNEVVAVGFGLAEDITAVRDRDAFLKVMQRADPERSMAGHVVGGGSTWRLLHEMNQGDDVLTYDSRAREYLVGRVVGPAEYSPQSVVSIPDFHHFRRVEWEGRVARDALSDFARRCLGPSITVFRVREEAAVEILARVRGQPVKPVAPTPATIPEREPEESASIGRDETVERARDLVTAKVDRLSWVEMQDLIAGILRAMGYKTRVSPRGPDQGRDIIASPDGLGLEQPRIVVEVKHRAGSIGAPDLRSFIGGLQPSDRGLYVSTGGFTRECRYEADRAHPPVTLLDLNELVALLIEHYDNADAKTCALVPLVPIYWPAG